MSVGNVFDLGKGRRIVLNNSPVWTYEPVEGDPVKDAIAQLTEKVNELTAEVNQLKQAAQDRTEESFW